MKAQIFLTFALATLGTSALAQTSSVCAKPSSTNDVVQCFETNHPEIQKLSANPTLIEGFRRESVQFPNPQITFQTEKGKNMGDVMGEDSVVVSELVQIGGKRSARRKIGLAKADGARADEQSIRAQIRIQTILNLVKYRQLNAEIAVLEEALNVYGRVQTTFASRPRLSPDQQVTSGLFKLAVGDYRHRLSSLVSDRLALEVYFRLIPDFNLKAAMAFLPQRPAKWPEFIAKNGSGLSAPLIKQAEAAFKEADGNYSLEKANAVPDPTLSLVGTRVVEGVAEYNRFGFAVSIGLPVFNLNGGAKMQASAAKTRAEIDYKRSIAQVEIERQNSLLAYQNYVKSLDAAPNAKDIESKHRTTESLYYRGVVSGVLMIEAHRQMLDFTQSQNELEYETFQALLNLYLIDGRLGEFKL